MTAPTLPGSIPGLLRRGSPVIQTTETRGEYIIPVGSRYTVLVVDDGSRCAADAAVLGAPGCFSGTHKREHIGLDLSDPTGRAHAAWWAVDYCGAEALRACGLSLLEWTGIRDCATHGLNMSPASIESLRRVCLHVAGVTP